MTALLPLHKVLFIYIVVCLLLFVVDFTVMCNRVTVPLGLRSSVIDA